MYEFYSKEELEKRFPILKTDADAIVNFTTCDGGMGYKLAAVIGALYPNIKYNYQNQCVKGLIGKGSLIINQKNDPVIINLPFKESFKGKVDEEYVKEGFKKLSNIYKLGKVTIKSIAIQRGICSDEILEEAIKDLELPEIIFYDEFNYYAKLEEETLKRKAEEKERLKLEKEKEKERLKLEKEKEKTKKAEEKKQKK